MAEEVHSSGPGLAALHWETAKTRLSPTALLLGNGELTEILSSFDIYCSTLEKE